MTDQKTCPDRETLEKMLLGKLPRPEIEAIGEHLQNCESCSDSAATMEVRDELTDTIRAGKPWVTSEAKEKVLAEVIRRGKELGSKLQTVQIEETQAGISSAEQAEPVVDSFAISQLREINFLAPAQQPDELGRLGDYRVLQLLGTGGMGMVFRAEDPKLKRQIALKVMKPSVASSQSAKDLAAGSRRRARSPV